VDHAIKTAHDLGVGIEAGKPPQPQEGRESSSSPPQPKWPDPDPGQIAAVLKEIEYASVEGLIEQSPVAVDGLTADDVLPRLFPAWGLVCCGMQEWHTVIGTVEVWLRTGKLGEYQYIVPNLMKATKLYDADGKLEVDKLGRPSVRKQTNVLARLYIVPEWDQATHDEQAAYIVWLSQYAPLVMVVDSGGKSLHPWYNTKGMSQKQLEDFFGLGCKLGADRSKWDAHGYVRLPGGWRSKYKKRQRIVYFNPNLI
jgi:hypothetical protein